MRSEVTDRVALEQLTTRQIRLLARAAEFGRDFTSMKYSCFIEYAIIQKKLTNML